METQNKGIHYNYYPIECSNIRNIQTQDMKNEIITSTYQGKINEPNLMYSDNGQFEIGYQATDLFLYGKIHDMNIIQDGELVILHRATTLSNKLYCCFPLIYDKKSPITEIDQILMSKNSNNYVGPLKLEMNKYITDLPYIRKYKTVDKFGEQCVVIFFDSIIYINSKLSVYDDQLFEINKSMSLGQTINYSNSVFLENKLRTPSIITEGFDSTSLPTPTSTKSSKHTKSPKPTPTLTAHTDDDEVVYSCEYLPVDSEDMVQVLQMPIGSPGYSSLVNNQVSNVFINNAIFMFIAAFIFVTSPLVHNTMKSRIGERYTIDIQGGILKGFNILNIVLSLILLILAIILLVVGFMTTNLTATSIGIFIPFFGFICYLGIIYFKSLKNNNIVTNNTMNKN